MAPTPGRFLFRTCPLLGPYILRSYLLGSVSIVLREVIQYPSELHEVELRVCLQHAALWSLKFSRQCQLFCQGQRIGKPTLCLKLLNTRDPQIDGSAFQHFSTHLEAIDLQPTAMALRFAGHSLIQLEGTVTFETRSQSLPCFRFGFQDGDSAEVMRWSLVRHGHTMGSWRILREEFDCPPVDC